ncbi:MAG: beta-galactosidase trimerization domain-containing protein [Candidatus Omnitrophota bacterium]
MNRAKNMRTLIINTVSAQHDSIILKERLDLDVTLISCGSSFYGMDRLDCPTVYWHFLGKSESETVSEIQSALEKNWELIILGPEPGWNIYPQEIRSKILEKVSNGTKLLVFSPHPDFYTGINQKELDKEMYVSPFVALAQEEKFQSEIYLYGKGKIAVLKTEMDHCYGYLTSYSRDKGTFEYKLVRVLRFIDIFVHEKVPLIKEISMEQAAPFPKIRISLNSYPKQVRLIVTVYDSDHETIKKWTFEQVSYSNETFILKNASLSDGVYFIETVACKGKVTLDWAGGWFEIKNSSGLEDVTLDKRDYKVGEGLEIPLKYRGKIDKPLLKVTLQDSWMRNFYEEEFSSLPIKLNIKIPEGSLSVLNFISLNLFNKDKRLCSKKIEFTLPENHPHRDFYLFLWDGRGASDQFWHSQDYWNKVRNFGIDGVSNVGSGSKAGTEEVARSLSLYNLICIPEPLSFQNITLENMFSEDWVRKQEELAKDAAISFHPYGTPAYTLGDEIYINPLRPEGRFWDSEMVWKEFQDYLKDLYSDIENLNKQWDSKYKSFSEIKFHTEEELLKNWRNPSPWVDFRMFMTQKFTSLHQRMRNIIKGISPDTFVGWDGTEQYSSYDGYDWWQYTQGFQFNNSYASYVIKSEYANKMFNGYAIRSFTGKENLRGFWMNDIDYSLGAKYVPWFTLFFGFNSIFWWHATTTGLEVEAFNYLYQPTPVFDKILQEVQQIKKGPATLLRHATLETDPIAIHYSENNWHASNLSTGVPHHINNLGLKEELWFSRDLLSHEAKIKEPEFNQFWKGIEPTGHYAVSSKNFITLMNDLGFQPNMVSRQQIEEGVLSNYRILILPYVESLSQGEVENIRKFVREGGMIIADYRCGIRDMHGKFHTDGGNLDEVFGINQKTYQVERGIKKVVVDGWLFPPGNFTFSASFEITFSQPGIEVTTGKSFGCDEKGTPVFIANKYGKGSALYCNFDIYNYFHLRKKGQEIPMRELFGAWIHDYRTSIGDKRPVFQDGTKIGQTDIFHFKDGMITYIGLLRDFTPEDHRTWEVAIPVLTRGHLYDVLTKEYCGFGEEINTKLEVAEPKLYACLPYKIKGLNIRGKQRVKQGEKEEILIEILTDPDAKPENHAVYIKVRKPDNIECVYLEKVIYLKNGKGKYILPIALNDLPGKWVLDVEEVISGKSELFSFTVSR